MSTDRAAATITDPPLEMEPAPERQDAATLLQLIWLASPALPIGGFSYSEGLESAVETARVTDEESARRWLLDQLALGLARCELPLLVQTLSAWREGDLARVAALNDWMLTTRETAEARLQTEQMGRSLAAWLQQRSAHDGSTGLETAARAALDGTSTFSTFSTLSTLSAMTALTALEPAPTYPVAFALAAAQAGATAREATLAYAFGWAENMVQAAVKSVPLGQGAGQRILGALAQAIPDAVTHALSLGDEERVAATPGLAILGARHETQYSRLFRS